MGNSPRVSSPCLGHTLALCLLAGAIPSAMPCAAQTTFAIGPALYRVSSRYQRYELPGASLGVTIPVADRVELITRLQLARRVGGDNTFALASLDFGVQYQLLAGATREFGLGAGLGGYAREQYDDDASGLTPFASLSFRVWPSPHVGLLADSVVRLMDHNPMWTGVSLAIGLALRP